jgi:hypothetical protein
MDRLGIDDGAGARPRLHQCHEDVNQLAGLDAENRRSPEFARSSVDEHFERSPVVSSSSVALAIDANGIEAAFVLDLASRVLPARKAPLERQLRIR